MQRRIVALLLLAVLVSLPAGEALAFRGALLRKAGAWVASTVAGYLVGKGIDRLTGQTVRDELEGEVKGLLDEIAKSVGTERRQRELELEVLRRQIALIDRALAATEDDIAHLQADQKRLDREVDDLERRLTAVEGRVGDLEGRVNQLEDALMVECLDLRHAALRGADAYRIHGSPQSQLVERYESDSLSLTAGLFLDSCNAELTSRGLFIQLALLTRGLDREMSLYATFQNVDTQGPRPGYLTHLARFEYPLDRPGYRVDGQVDEIFIPYDEIPFPPHSDRLALALVLAHDGSVVYSLPARTFSCVFAQRTRCRWR